MELYYLEIAGKSIISLIVSWVVYMAINKWVWTPLNQDPNPVRKDDPGSHPSSSAESLLSLKHDVFLSFRGPDTRRSITTEIYLELQKRGISAFMDEQDLVIGSPISPSLLMAIKQSRFAILILSQNYAFSPWCLEELTKIVECMQDHDRILPLFYDVIPSDVRYQKASYGVAFKEHQKKSRHDTNKLKQWRDALKKVGKLSGWESKNFKSDRELVKDIVESMCSRLQPIEPDCAMSTEEFEAFGSTREATDKVMKALKDDEINIIGVYGMGGVGKTTVVKYVGEQACKIGIFDHVIMAIVSQIPDLIKIQGTLADMMGVKLVEETEMGRAARLKKEIRRRNKVLIIMDDVWNRIELSSIGIPCYDKLKTCNSKILFTTRRLQVCHSMNSQTSIYVKILSRDDSWNLFLKKSSKSIEKSSKFYDIARRVARECCGLPIALIAVARALVDKDLMEWERACRRLEKSQVVNLDDDRAAFECIKLSYDYLKDEDCKSCFLLCCLFPEDYDIQMMDLFKYGYGIGLFRDADTIQEARETAKSVVMYLKSSSLLMDCERSGCVRMHDVIRDTAIQIAQDGFLVRAGQDLMDWPPGLHEGYSAVSLMWNNIFCLPKWLLFPKLEILLLQGNKSIKKIPRTCFQSLNELRVLDLSRTGISSLPKTSSLLTNLQALYLDYCLELYDISIVGKLEKLEILSMKISSLEELPREIGDLTNLRILDMTDAKIIRIPSKVISKLHRLEELYMRCKFWRWGRSTYEGENAINASFEEVISLSNLRALQVCIFCSECIPKTVEFVPNWVEFNIVIGKRDRWLVPSSRIVHINANITLPDWFFNVVIYKAERLEWRANMRLIDIFVEYQHGKFHGLKHLAVDNRGESKDTTSIWQVPWEVPIRYGHRENGEGYHLPIWYEGEELPKDPVLENLEELHLMFLGSVEELHLGELPPGSLFNLKVLEVKSCKNWGNVLIPAELFKRLPNLEKLDCGNMDEIEYVFGCEDFQPEQSRLREMLLFFLIAVRSICDGPAPPAIFLTLERLVIYHCNIEGSLFTSDVAQCLFHLEEVEMWFCPLIQKIVEASNKKIILPKLKSLTLRELPELCYETATIDFECPSLVKLDVMYCPKFSVSISDFRNKSSFPEFDES